MTRKWSEQRKRDASKRVSEWWTPERKGIARLRYILRTRKSTLFCNKHGVCIDLSLD